MPRKFRILRTLAGCCQRLVKPTKQIKYRIISRVHTSKLRNSYTRSTKPKNRRRARFRGIRNRVHRSAFKHPQDPEKKNVWMLDNIWVGNQDDAAVLKHENITRVFHLDRKTIVLQPHVDNTPGRLPQLAFYDAYDYEKNNFLKDFEGLCAIMRVEAWLGNDVLIYCATHPSREDHSRVRMLVIAYGMYTGIYRPKRFHKRLPKPFKGVRIKHMEQMRVWNAMVTAKDEAHRADIYSAWQNDKEWGFTWRERCVRTGQDGILFDLERAANPNFECLMM